jgi:DNA repair protein RecN (Recombination protein N)
MLSSLHIENIAVIKRADIDMSEGFHVLTGETGAGKSILIDSIELLMGGKVSSDLIRNGETKATVCAMFTDVGQCLKRLPENIEVEADEDGCLLISRSFDEKGKATTKINGRTVPVSLQRELMPYLINIHGQNDNRILLSSASHLEYLDNYADNSKLLEEYCRSYEAYESCKKQILALRRDERDKARTIELLRYQVADIDAAKLKEGEEEQLKGARDKVKNAEKIMKQTSLVLRALYRGEKTLPAYELVKKSITAIESVADYVPNADSYIERLTNISYELEDIGLSVGAVAEADYDDPDAELDRIESRLDQISKLKKKYGSTVDEIIEFRNRSEKELHDIELSDERIEELKLEASNHKKIALDLAATLSERRRQAALILEGSVVDELAFLEMPKVRFKVDIKRSTDADGKTALTKTGTDIVEFLISANPGEPLKPMVKIASGGELSRIMLALKNINSYGYEGQTLIFDEIDTGVSGKTSQKIGMRLRRLSKSNQVICVTHSAQIACEAHHQYLISKKENDGRVETSVELLDREGRVKEIARIMGGVNITDKLLQSASEMLDAADCD